MSIFSYVIGDVVVARAHAVVHTTFTKNNSIQMLCTGSPPCCGQTHTSYPKQNWYTIQWWAWRQIFVLFSAISECAHLKLFIFIKTIARFSYKVQISNWKMTKLLVQINFFVYNSNWFKLKLPNLNAPVPIKLRTVISIHIYCAWWFSL